MSMRLDDYQELSGFEEVCVTCQLPDRTIVCNKCINANGRPIRLEELIYLKDHYNNKEIMQELGYSSVDSVKTLLRRFKLTRRIIC